MTVFQQQLPNDSASLIRRIEQLERDAQEARAARRLEAATIGRGGITIKGGAIVLQDSAGREIARMGIREDLVPGPDGPQPGFLLRRNDGSVALTLDDPDGGNPLQQMLKIQDAAGNIIFSEDFASGFGIGGPIFSAGAFYPTQGNLPGTSSTTLTQVMSSLVPVTHPRLIISAAVLVPNTSGVTGQAQLKANGTVVDTFTCPTNTFGTYQWNVDAKGISGGSFGSTVYLEILLARVGATVETISVSPNSILSVGS